VLPPAIARATVSVSVPNRDKPGLIGAMTVAGCKGVDFAREALRAAGNDPGVVGNAPEFRAHSSRYGYQCREVAIVLDE
jgi:hypothetical protein